jgi:hypothetical protein
VPLEPVLAAQAIVLHRLQHRAQHLAALWAFEVARKLAEDVSRRRLAQHRHQLVLPLAQSGQTAEKRAPTCGRFCLAEQASGQVIGLHHAVAQLVGRGQGLRLVDHQRDDRVELHRPARRAQRLRDACGGQFDGGVFQRRIQCVPAGQRVGLPEEPV